MNDNIKKFLDNLGLKFNNEELLITALSHRSVGKKNYERLEFLGDSVLGMVISSLLFKEKPLVAEGALSKYRSHLVCQPTLVDLAKKHNVNDVVIFGKSEQNSNALSHESILADVVEALIGALYIDQGFAMAEQFITTIFKSKVENLPDIERIKDSKSKLQEHLQAKKIELPIYTLIDAKHDHPQYFHIKAQIISQQIEVKAGGTSRRSAEQIAAAKILEIFGE